MENIIQILYMIAAVLFIVGLQRLSRVRSARGGNFISLVGMLLAIAATLLDLLTTGRFHLQFMIAPIVIGTLIGIVWAHRVPMTSMPQMVGVFNGFGGLASMFVAYSYFYEHSIRMGGGVLAFVNPDAGGGVDVAVTVMLSILVGGVTFSGSMIAAAKLQGWVSEQPVLMPGRHLLNIFLVLAAVFLGGWAGFVHSPEATSILLVIILGIAALFLGVGLTIPIGGADMPVVICLLNAYSGIAGALTGFVIKNNLLIIAGSLVGSSGIILTDIMCKAMNRSLANVLFGGFGAQAAVAGGKSEYVNVKSVGAEEAAMLLESASSVIFVPGYGLAVAQAQHAAADLGNLLEKNGIKVSYAIHPVAGRMPGHMNVLLAEANVPYDRLFEMDAINDDFKNTDVVIVLGANDVVNPVALHDKTSPIYGMPILRTHEARTVIVVKRSLASGFAGIKNDLFEYPNCMMFFSDAKAALQKMKEEFAALKK